MKEIKDLRIDYPGLDLVSLPKGDREALGEALNMMSVANATKTEKEFFATAFGLAALMRLEGESHIREKSISPVGDLPLLEDLKKPVGKELKRLQSQVTIIKLNGGLGTSMGMKRPKSLLEVRKDRTFMDVMVAGAKDQPLVLVNTFATHQSTSEYLKSRDMSEVGMLFSEAKFPRLDMTEDHIKIPDLEGDQRWSPPGHVYVYEELYRSGMLDNLIEQGREYAFISNADNLGATVDYSIPHYMDQERIRFLLEAVRRRPSDIKGGHLAMQDGHLILREVAQCHPNDQEAFEDYNKHRYFNSNNIWIHLRSLRAEIESKGSLHAPVILNQKDVDGRLIIQLEGAMGAVIETLRGEAIRVPSSRFSPVKKLGDYLTVMSDAYKLNMKRGSLQLAKKRSGVSPKVDIKGIPIEPESISRMCPYGVPSLIDCKSLNIFGNVIFEKGAKISGDVEIHGSDDPDKALRLSGHLHSHDGYTLKVASERID